MDWPVHQCANLYQVASSSTLVAVPYLYEDTLSERDLADIPKSDPVHASYAVMHVNPNRTIQQYVVESLSQLPVSDEGGRGLAPPASSNKGIYSMAIKYGDEKERVVKGSVQNDAIYKGNVNNPLAHELAGRVGPLPECGSIIYWPKLGTSIAAPTNTFRIPFSIEFEAPHLEKKVVLSGYVQPSSSSAAMERVSRRTQQNLQQKLETKFKTAAAARGVRLFRVTDPTTGHGAVLSLSPKGDLIDVEMMIAPSQKTEKTEKAEARFVCNPRSVDDVVGLAMALELAEAMDPTNETIKQTIGVVRNHAHALTETDGPVPISSQVNAAINVATNHLFAPVGETARVSEFVHKIVRGGPNTARQLANKLIEDIRKTRGSLILRDYRTGRVSRQIDDLILAVTQMRNSVQRTCPDSDEVAAYDRILADLLNLGKNPSSE
jgi:hypothetical protein